MAAAGGRRMVQKESQAVLEERESELNSNPAASAGASLEPQASPAPGEDNPTGAGGAAVAGAAGGARRFLCGVVEGESCGAGWAGVSSPRPTPAPHPFLEGTSIDPCLIATYSSSKMRTEK